MAESEWAVYAALAGNVAIATTKFIAAAVSGSSAMLAESLHSLVDSGDSLLLLFGRHRSRRPPDADHPFGHGQELYFWTFVVSILIFGAGGGFSVYEGLSHVLHPAVMENAKLAYIVLGIAAVFECASLFVGLWQFWPQVRGTGFWRAVRTGKDPTVFTVVFEDTAAVVGLVIAFLGIWLANTFRNPVLDGCASIAIGLLLMAVAVLLARESKGLLVGEAMDRASVEGVRQTMERDPAVTRVSRPLTVHFGPENILLAVDVEFGKGLSGPEVAAAIDRLESAVRQRYPKIRRIFIEAESIGAAVGEGRPAGP